MVELAQAQPSTRGEGPGQAPGEELQVERRSQHSAVCKWSIANFAQAKQKTLWSKFVEVGGYDCRLLVYPSGDSQALPGYISIYLQISDPGNNNSKWDCFASYRLSVRNLVDDSKSVHRDSWHRFSAKKKSHGWCDFAALSLVLDPKQGFLGPGDTIQISTDITILHESVTFTRESDLSGAAPSATGDVYSGKFVWRVHNFSAFQPLLKTQKIMSPGFPAGDCVLRLSVYQSTVSATDYLSVCLESKDTEKAGPSERTCWCLFRLAVASQAEAGRQVHKDSYGRFAADSKAGDNTSLGWNDFMRMSDFLAPEGAYLVGDTAVFSTSFHVIREYTTLSRNLEPRAGQAAGQLARYKDKRKMAARESDFAGKFTWRIEHFTRLKDLLKKRKITGLCIKSKRFTIGGRDCRLIVYPRGQSQPPTYLSMFLEVCDPRAPSPDWTCFVSHRLAVVNQKAEAEKSVSKESQNRYSKTAKDWGWREFVSLTTLFDADAGFLVNDAVVFAAEVLVLRENCEIRHQPLLPSEVAAAGHGPPGHAAAAAAAALPAPPAPAGAGAPPAEGEAGASGRPPSAQGGGDAGALVPSAGSSSSAVVAAGGSGEAEKTKTVFTWRIENFQAFKDIMETRKIFSRFFSVGPCELRIGLYESFESLCLYLESDVATAPPSQQAGAGADAAAEKPPNYWVRYRMAVVNQRHPDRTEWKEAAICTRSWNNSVLQFMRVPSSAAEGDAGYVLRDSLAITCEVLECCPWLDFAEGELGSGAAEGPPLPSGAAAAGPGMGTSANAADKALSLSHDGGSEADEDDEEGYSDETDADDEVDSDVDLGDEEDAVSGWLQAAGVTLGGGSGGGEGSASGGAGPPVIPDPQLVRRALAATLLHQPGAVPMFVASLRMYMDTLAKVKCLLMPGVITTTTVGSAAPESSEAGEAGGEPPASGSSLMHVLMGLPQLRQPLLGMLLDVMLDHCLTARMHKHQLRKQAQRTVAAAAHGGGGAAAGEVARPGGASPGAPASLGSLGSSSGTSRAGAGEGSASSGYVSSEESSYEDAFDAPGEAAAHWADDALQAAVAAAAAAAADAEHGQAAGQLAQRMPNGVLRGLTPLPPRRPPQAAVPGGAAAVTTAAGAPSSSSPAADLAGATPATPAAELQVAAEAARHDEPGDAGDAVTDLEEEGEEAGSGEGAGASCPSVSEVEQVVALILSWLRGLDPSLLQPLPAKLAGPGGGAGAAGGAVMRAPLSSLQKVSMLLADAPRTLQPDIIMLVPRLVDPSEHTAAAGTLLGRLAEASREGAEAEGQLRMPVLAALGMLHIDPAVADKVLHAALEALPCLSESELPPAVGLVLKLASESAAAPGLAVRVVRQRVRAAAGATSAGTLDAVRLAVLQHRDVARTMLADMEADAREALALAVPAATEQQQPQHAEAAAEAAAPAPGRRRRSNSMGSTGSDLPPIAQLPPPQQGAAVPGPGTLAVAAAAAAAAPPAPTHLQLQLCDMEVLLDLLSLPELQREAVAAAELCTAAGTLCEAEMAALVERRRLQQLVVTSAVQQAAAAIQQPLSPASPARAAAAAPDAAAAGSPTAQQMQAQHPAAPGSPLGSAALQEETPGAPASPPTRSATLLSALSLLEAQGGAGRLSAVSTAAALQMPPLPSLAAALPQQPQQQPAAAATAAPSASTAVSPAPLPPAASAAAAADEFGGLVSLAECLLASASERCRSLALLLYRSLFRLYCDDPSRRRLLRGLVQQALGSAGSAGAAAQLQLPGAGSLPAVVPRSAPGSAPSSRPASAGSVAPPSAAGRAPQLLPAAQEGPADAAGRWPADELLGSLLAEQPGAARIVVGLSMEAARAAAQQAEGLLRQLAAREAASARELASAREEAARQASSKSRYMERAGELDTQLTRLKAEHRAELAGLASDKKELQTQIRHLETQLEWVRSERDEERASKSKEGREAAQRATEAEAQLTRLKGQRREDQKRWQKEKTQLAERLKEAEERQRTLEQEASRLRAESSTQSHRHDKAAAELRRRLDAAERVAAEREGDATKARAAAADADVKLRAHQDALRKLERRLAEEVGRSAAVLHGAGIDALGADDLEALGRVHEQGLKRVNGLLAKRGRAPVGAAAAPPEQPLTRSASPAMSGGAATPVPSATASPIDVAKATYRASMTPHSHAHPHHQQQHGVGHHAGLRGAGGPPSPAPLPPTGLPPSAAATLHAQLQSLSAAGGAAARAPQANRALSLNSSMDSLQSLGSVGSASSSLFSGPWGSSVHSIGALQQAAAAAAAAGGGGAAGAAGRRVAQQQQAQHDASAANSSALDAANMEKLMGLLPSDLLHS